MAFADDTGSEAGVVAMNFHMYSTVYAASNSSILVYNGADTASPIHSTPLTAVVSCGVRQSAQLWFTEIDAWLGGISWITQPLAEDMTVQGNVTMTVWMSTPDPSPVASGYAFGIAEVDGMGNPTSDPVYQYYYEAGSVLTPRPAPIRLAFYVDRTFMKSRIIGFFVIVGSTAEGWRYHVHFDSPNMNSSAELPALNVPIPEFSHIGAVLSMAVAALCSHAVIRKRSRTPSDS